LNSHGSDAGAPYNGIMGMVRVKSIAGAAAAALFACVLAWAPAHAQTATDVTLPAAAAPVVRMQMRSGTLVIRTWNQPLIHVTSSDPVTVRPIGPFAVARALRGGDIPIFSTTVQDPSGTLTLPAEDFSVPSLATGQHDGALVFGGDTGAAVTLTVPATTAFIWAAVARGRIQMQDYHGGAFVARVHNGMIQVSNVSGEGYVEVARGPIVVNDSGFDRIRARTAIGNVLFQRCTSRQIEVSSINGSIAYDNGTFAPGLARFESQNGNVALGVAGGGVQIGAHSASGKIFESFDRGANVRGSATDAQATLGGGGPVVTASSQRGGVYMYDGAFKSHPRLPAQWRAVGRILNRRRPGNLQQKKP